MTLAEERPPTAAPPSVLRRLRGARSREELMKLAAEAVRSLLHADGATFVLRDGERCYYAEEDAISPLWKGGRFPMSACISGWCMMRGQTAAIPDIYKDPRIPVDAYRPTFVRSLAMAPVGREPAIAALGAYWSRVRRHSDADLAVLQELADAVAPALARLDAAAALTDAPRPPARPRVPLGHRLAEWIRHRSRGLERNSPLAYAFAAGCVLTAGSVRAGLEALGVHGLPAFSTLYPAVLLALLVGGTGPAVAALLGGGILAYWAFFTPEATWTPPTPDQVVAVLLYLGSGGLAVWIVRRYEDRIVRLAADDARHLTLAREQGHRLRNAMAVVEAIIGQSLRGAPDQAAAISRRVRAGLAQLELGEPTGGELSLRQLVADHLEAFEPSRFAVHGDLDAPVAQDVQSLLGLALHELATNALKYGALSSPAGRVDIGLQLSSGAVKVVWQESGGPPVTPPGRRGYGSVLLNRLVETRGGSIAQDFAPAGASAELCIPLKRRRRS